jgi:hypothetical protein
MGNRGLRRGLLAVLAGAAALVLAAPAYAGNIWVIKTAPSPSTGQPIVGGGSWIVNKPSGYYIGRAMVGTKFDVVSTTSSNWHYGRAIDTVNMCGWVMPGSMNYQVGSQADSCSATSGVVLDMAHRLYIGKDFNAPAHDATDGTSIPAGSCAFYYNYFYGSNFSSNGGHWNNYAGNTSAGYVMYRFTTRDGGARVVRDPNLGWGFVPSWCVGTTSTVYNDND